jgi:hypothetical protein
VRFRANQHVRIIDFWQMAQNLRDPLRGKLASSARTGGVVDQTLFSAPKQHG